MKTLENIEFLISKNYETGSLNDSDLVQIIELCGQYLGIKTRSQYAKDNQISYNGVKHHRKNIGLFGCNFVFDND